MEIREFQTADGTALRSFWESCGITIRPGDDDAALALFAARNPDLFLIATDERGIAASARRMSIVFPLTRCRRSGRNGSTFSSS